MPYTEEERRAVIKQKIRELGTYMREELEAGVGDYNFATTELILTSQPAGYTDINGLMGMLLCCALELYRRMAAPYEDLKILMNGDVEGYEAWDRLIGKKVQEALDRRMAGAQAPDHIRRSSDEDD